MHHSLTLWSYLFVCAYVEWGMMLLCFFSFNKSQRKQLSRASLCCVVAGISQPDTPVTRAIGPLLRLSQWRDLASSTQSYLTFSLILWGNQKKKSLECHECLPKPEIRETVSLRKPQKAHSGHQSADSLLYGDTPWTLCCPFRFYSTLPGNPSN